MFSVHMTTLAKFESIGHSVGFVFELNSGSEHPVGRASFISFLKRTGDVSMCTVRKGSACRVGRGILQLSKSFDFRPH